MKFSTSIVFPQNVLILNQAVELVEKLIVVILEKFRWKLENSNPSFCFSPATAACIETLSNASSVWADFVSLTSKVSLSSREKKKKLRRDRKQKQLWDMKRTFENVASEFHSVEGGKTAENLNNFFVSESWEFCKLFYVRLKQ